MAERINLDEQMEAGRQTIDAKWSPTTRRLVTVGAVVVAVGAITGGVWTASAFSTPGLPATAEEALAVLGSPRFERMSAGRKSAYAEEAGRLLRELPEESRRDMFRDEEQRQAMRALMQQRMGDMARAVARGETPDFRAMFRGARPPGDPDRQRRREEMTEEEREARRAERRERMRERMNEQFQSGNAQTGALMGEMFKTGSFGGGRGGGGRGGGGGGRG